jgi:PadR family transcriptional regulator, regulatory protein AphA
MADLNLTPTSYLVLGLVAAHGPCTSYDLKSLVAISIGRFWPFPHSQLYAEPARLAEHGFLDEEQEDSGRRRRTYAIALQGREALDDWLAEPPIDERTELRDLGLLKLFFGSLSTDAALVALAEAKRDAHAAAGTEYEQLRDRLNAVATPAELATLELGIRWERTASEFWSGIALDPPTGPAAAPPG